MVKYNLLFLLFGLMVRPACAQLKFLIEDFEGLKPNSSSLGQSGLYRYGNCSVRTDLRNAGLGVYNGRQVLSVTKMDAGAFGGWGKGITFFVELDAASDFFNFYVLQTKATESQLRVTLQEDDNEDSQYNKDQDDSWDFSVSIPASSSWQLISLPLSSFSDVSPGGDGKFNVSYQTGKLLGVLFNFVDEKKVPVRHEMAFDFLCISKGKLPHSVSLFDPPSAEANEFCALGAWSYGEGNMASFVDIARTFEKQFPTGDAKLGIVHFFQPFGKEEGSSSLYPSADRINKVIDAGYLPMITLENHFVSTASKLQPNLYSILEGHFDSFFGYWCHLIKEVKGPVLLRILHEFNGDWYSWCTANNDRNPELVARTFRYIYKIFEQNQVKNVQFIWCPNSMSVPQEKWNDMLSAYPGDDYVDFVGLDIYNGAGAKSDQWRSFRKEGIQNYFVLREKFPNKPIFICESASRNRKASEQGQSKADWIRETAAALKTDMAGIRLYTWFNQGDAFDLQKDTAARDAFYSSFFKDSYFMSGAYGIRQLIR